MVGPFAAEDSGRCGQILGGWIGLADEKNVGDTGGLAVKAAYLF